MKILYLSVFLTLFLLNLARATQTRDSLLPRMNNAALSVLTQNFTVTKNFVVKKTYLDSSGMSVAPRVISDITYVDGLGRKLQDIQVNGSPGELLILFCLMCTGYKGG